VPKPQQSLFPLFIALRNEWASRKAQRLREEEEVKRNNGNNGDSQGENVLVDKDNPLLRRPSMNADGYYFK